jgi:hypothetical protein
VTLPHAPVGSPYQAPRDCVLFGFTPEEKEAIARHSKDGRGCWHCGRRFIPKRLSGLPRSECCSYDCEQARELCFRLERDDLIEEARDRTHDRDLEATAFLPDWTPEIKAPTVDPPPRVISAWCALCHQKLGPFKRRSDATRGLRRHQEKAHKQLEF